MRACVRVCVEGGPGGGGVAFFFSFCQPHDCEGLIYIICNHPLQSLIHSYFFGLAVENIPVVFVCLFFVVVVCLFLFCVDFFGGGVRGGGGGLCVCMCVGGGGIISDFLVVGLVLILLFIYSF